MFSKIKNLNRKFLLLLTIGAVGIMQAPATFAQDDLSLPGDEAATTTPTAPDAEAEGGGTQSPLELVLQGGWAMIPLFAMLFAIIALTVYMFMDITPKNFSPPELLARLDQSMSEADLESTMQAAETSPTCLGQVTYGAAEYISERGYEVLDQDTIYDLMADASQDFNRKRATIINWFSVISQAAPMVGLLGTVSGMIKAFRTLGGPGGMGDPGKLAGNISEALVTTASGLIVALPAIFFYFFFRDKLAAQVAEVERNVGRMLNNLRRVVYSHYEETEAAAGTPPPMMDGTTPPPPA